MVQERQLQVKWASADVYSRSERPRSFDWWRSFLSCCFCEISSVCTQAGQTAVAVEAINEITNLIKVSKVTKFTKCYTICDLLSGEVWCHHFASFYFRASNPHNAHSSCRICVQHFKSLALLKVKIEPLQVPYSPILNSLIWMMDDDDDHHHHHYWRENTQNIRGTLNIICAKTKYRSCLKQGSTFPLIRPA